LAGFTLLDFLALGFFVAAWLAYHLAVEKGPHAGRSLNALMNERRHQWVRQAMLRDNRIIDTQVMTGLLNGTGFFASTALLAVGGSMALLQSTDAVLKVFEDLPIASATTRAAWEMKVIGLAVIFSYGFFKFAWSYRLFNYCMILLGAIPKAQGADDPVAVAAADECAAMNVVAGRHFNRGQRAFFFGLAYLGWFLGAYVLIGFTAAVLLVMWNRQFHSDSIRALKGSSA
jgi:uncharacterized membrane protein